MSATAIIFMNEKLLSENGYLYLILYSLETLNDMTTFGSPESY